MSVTIRKFELPELLNETKLSVDLALPGESTPRSLTFSGQGRPDARVFRYFENEQSRGMIALDANGGVRRAVFVVGHKHYGAKAVRSTTR
jgi:hypothetical protein